MMARSVWLTIGVALVAGAAGGAVGRLTAGSASSRTPAKSSAAEAEAEAEADGESPTPPELGGRIAALEREVARLKRERQIARLLASDGGGPAPGAGAAVDDPVFETAVRDVLERVDEERDDERRQRRSERSQRFADRWAADVAQKLALSDDQKQKVAQIMREQLDAMAGRRNGDAGADLDRGQWREAMRAEREKTDKKLAEVLTSAQLKQLETLQESGELPGPWGRRRQP